MGRVFLFSQLQTNRVCFCVLALDLFFGGPIVFKYMICLSIAIQNSHLMRYIISIRILSPSMYPFTFHNPHHLSLSPKGKGMLGKESSLVTALRYSTMLSSSSLALSLSLSLSLSTEQLSLHSRSLHSTKSQQHRTKCSSNDKTLNVS